MFRRLVDNISIGMSVIQDDKFCYANQRFLQLTGYRLDELQNTLTLQDLLGSSALVKETKPNCHGVPRVAELTTKSGQTIAVDFHCVSLEVKGQLKSFVVIDPVGSGKADDAAAQLAHLVYENTSEAIVVTDKDGIVVDANPAFSSITGYSVDEVKGQRMSLLSSKRQSPEFYQRMWAELHETGRWQGDIWNLRKNGEEYAERLHITTIWNADGMVYRHIGLFSDITQHKKREAIMLHQAHYDHLTGLLNRQVFQQRLQEAIDDSGTTGAPFALLFIDLDLFKEVNDTLGHSAGDRLLKEVGQRLLTCVRESDTVARVGGDEFTIIISQVSDTKVLERICRQVLRKIAKPYILGDEVAMVSASVGVTLYPEDGLDAGELMKNADMAMYAAKACGRNQFCFFLPAMREAVHARLQFSRELQTAITEKQFSLYFQPVIDAKTGEVMQVEALLRWNHPAMGVVPPSEFLPFAEETGMIVEIGNWVFSAALEQAARWKAEGRPCKMSINVSPVQFLAAGINAEEWLEQIAQADLDTSTLVIEITERVLIEANPGIRRSLDTLKEAGLEIALDDFGTGFSSLMSLQRHPIDYIKIDQAFMRGVVPESDNLALCEAIIVMAHKLGLRVVAEGVGTHVQLDIVQGFKCDYVQGYLFTQPVPADEFAVWHQSWVNNGFMSKENVN